jgi:outer membrane protein OmpA-like peptidoglycan-associated protein
MITGNCDARGDAAFNLRLGKKRADATKKFLVTEYGIDESRLFTESKGKNDLLDPKELDVNRRVDFKFIKDK